MTGSSPLARGSRRRRRRQHRPRRIIPARAGFTRQLRPGGPLGSDHPRSRGVHQGVPTQLLAIIGSSPLARGSRHWGQRLQGDEGIIPARAGFTQGPSPCSWLPPDHPRSRGVHFGLEEDSALVDGSSPLARGSQVGFSGDALGVRIIPARAGFTLADPWNPNDESPYQTSFAFTADLALAPQSSDNAAVAQRSTRTPSEA